MEKPPILRDEPIKVDITAELETQRDADAAYYEPMVERLKEAIFVGRQQARQETAREICEEIERFSEKLDAHHTTGISSFLEFLKAKYIK